MASTPRTQPSSTIRSAQKNSSKRVMPGYLCEVWKSVCKMWKPVLSAANQVRCTFMPPKKRTLMWPSSLRLQGQPQCSSCTISSAQCATKYSTASWSHSQSPPETVSSKWLSRVSSVRTTPAEPPSAATVWLRMGTTLETRATLSRGSLSVAAIAARKPDPPPPTTTTSVRTTCIAPPTYCTDYRDRIALKLNQATHPTLDFNQWRSSREEQDRR